MTEPAVRFLSRYVSNIYLATDIEASSILSTLNKRIYKYDHINSMGGLLSPGVVAEMMKEEARADRKWFWALHLNDRNKVIEKELAVIGSATSALAQKKISINKPLSLF